MAVTGRKRILITSIIIAHLGVLLVVGMFYVRKPAETIGGNPRNRLAQEKSPYLLQHADNPVDWYPWGTEAFEKAKRENKPIFLSIGYSTCHWCHVMEHESFEDEQVARLMNDAFVSIKVDREERPDIDDVYMTVCQMLTGSGGWPLTIVMTPDKKPFFAGTYFPKESRLGRVGMMELIPQIKEIWRTRRGDVERSAEEITSLLREKEKPEFAFELGEETLKYAYKKHAEGYDTLHKGFGSAPKFPSPHSLIFLIRHWKRTGEEYALRMATETLDAMALGGIYDHLGGGFHRYSTDASWKLPHFEKMLYDQAMHLLAYTEAYQATGDEHYAQIAREIAGYVLRDMTQNRDRGTSIEGGFYSAEDADSEGEEGKFYVWALDEVRRILGGEDAQLFASVFNLEEGGNFQEEATGRRTSANVLFLKKRLVELARDFGMSPDALGARVEQMKRKLFAEREKRVRPHLDDKILTDWNGLMVAGLARAGAVFGEPELVKQAEVTGRFILEKMRDENGKLLHRYRGGKAEIKGMLDDYAFLIWGLIELYEATFDTTFLESALDLNDELVKHFWDDDEGGFYLTADDAEVILARRKTLHDGAIPSGNSVAMLNLIRLARFTGKTELEEKASLLAKASSALATRVPTAFTQMLTAVEFAVGEPMEILIVSEEKGDAVEEMLKTVRQSYIPNKVVLLKLLGMEEEKKLAEIAPFTRDFGTVDGKATAYVCKNYACQAPVTDADELALALNGGFAEKR